MKWRQRRGGSEEEGVKELRIGNEGLKDRE